VFVLAGFLSLVCVGEGAVLLVRYFSPSSVVPPLSLEDQAAILGEAVEYGAGPEVFPNPAAEDALEEPVFADLPEPETGAGTLTVDRNEDLEYRIRPGETISGIARDYDISYRLLAYYNNIANVNRIRAGMVILIPSLENAEAAEGRMAQPRQASPAAVRPSVKSARIGYESRLREAGPGALVQFSVLDPPLENLQSFDWDFGDGKRGNRPDPSHEYTAPKTYLVRLTARDASGTVYRSNPLYIDIPHPGSVTEQSATRFVTLSRPDEYFEVNGTITRVARYASVEAAPLQRDESSQAHSRVRFTKPGFYGLTVNEEGRERYYSVFVSPLPSAHADRGEHSADWYRTQFNTGTTSNCGPASVSMAIGWSLGKYFPVSQVRQAVGWQGNGGTSFEELRRVIQAQGVPTALQPLQSVQHIKEVIDSGGIAIVLFRTDGVRGARSAPASDLFGKYYNDSVGHYIVVKGYSLNGEYFIVHDPIPSDWGTNSFRYGDEVSMIGRNRYYSSAELLRSLRRPDMIVVSRPTAN
jgi:hypothetical protein